MKKHGAVNSLLTAISLPVPSLPQLEMWAEAPLEFQDTVRSKLIPFAVARAQRATSLPKRMTS
jgi:hypothetical protein